MLYIYINIMLDINDTLSLNKERNAIKSGKRAVKKHYETDSQIIEREIN